MEPYWETQVDEHQGHLLAVWFKVVNYNLYISFSQLETDVGSSHVTVKVFRHLRPRVGFSPIDSLLYCPDYRLDMGLKIFVH